MAKRLNLVVGAALAVFFLAFSGKCAEAEESADGKEDTAAAASKESVQMTFDAARKKAAEEKKPILLSFNGSDWCPWCMKLEEEVFDKDEFQNWAEENVVMYVADFPRKKKIDPEMAKKNQELADKYKVDGYPTVILIRADGSEIARTGYREGGPEKYIGHLKGLLKKF